MKHPLLILLLTLVSLLGISSAQAESKPRSVFGVWMLASETAPDGKETPQIYTQYTRCKIFDSDSTYYTVQLHAVGEDMMIIAHEMGHYRLNDSVYIENGRVMPFEWVDDTTFITTYEGYKEKMVRSDTMTEERKQEIRDLVRQHPNDADAPVKHFVLSTTERQLKAENKAFLYIIICMGLVAIGVVVYVHRLRKRKREIEKKLAEIEEENHLRPVVVADAMKQVETEFFQSDYYMNLRKRIEAGENFRETDWKELEQQLKVVYPRFSSSLYGLHKFSLPEYQMCLLLKIHTAPIEIAAVLNKEKSTISSMRRRLYKKVFDKEGSGKDWDEFIMSL